MELYPVVLIDVVILDLVVMRCDNIARVSASTPEYSAL